MMMRHTRRSRSGTFHNSQSVAEKDAARGFRRGSVQSINTFSLRRLLGSDPVTSHAPSSQPLLGVDGTKSAALPASEDGDGDTGPSSFTDNFVDVISQTLLNRQVSHDGHEDGDLCGRSSNEPEAGCSSPKLHRREYNAHIEKPPENLAPNSQLNASRHHRPLLANKLYLPSPHMGSKVSALARPAPLKENQPPPTPRVTPETGKLNRRPASSPAPPMPARLNSVRLPVPDRLSSITPRPINSYPSSDHPPTPFLTHRPHVSAPNPQTIPSPNPHGFQLHPPRVSSASSATKNLNPLTPASPPISARSFPVFHTSPTGAPLPVAPPPLTQAHYACYQSHKHMYHSPNVHNPVPCMACGAEEGQARWKCCWCCLRVCKGCIHVLRQVPGRDLAGLLTRLEEGRAGLGGWKGRTKRVCGITGGLEVGIAGKEEGELGNGEVDGVEAAG